MDVVDIYYVGGFGVMGWVSASEYGRSQPDPLADSMVETIQHMNADHKDSLVVLAQKFARIEAQEATMIAIDRLGFHVRVKTSDGVRGARIAENTRALAGRVISLPSQNLHSPSEHELWSTFPELEASRPFRANSRGFLMDEEDIAAFWQFK